MKYIACIYKELVELVKTDSALCLQITYMVLKNWEKSSVADFLLNPTMKL